MVSLVIFYCPLIIAKTWILIFPYAAVQTYWDIMQRDTTSGCRDAAELAQPFKLGEN